jgi:hypothetical protein
MVDVDAEDVVEMAAVEDQKPVETLGADRFYEAFCDRVCLGRPRRRLHDPDTFGAEDLVERAAVLAVAVADQEARPLEQSGEAEVRGLLRNPLAVGVCRAAREPDPAGGVFDEEQYVVAAQEQRLDGQEVARDKVISWRECADVRQRVGDA